MSDETKTYELMDAGYYSVRNTDIPQVVEASTGTLQVALQVTFEGGRYDGRNRLLFLSLSEKSMPYTKEKLESMGWNGDLDFKEPLPNVTRASIKHETNAKTGAVQDKIDIFAKKDIKFEGKKASPDALAKAKAELRALGATKKGDDLPF